MFIISFMSGKFVANYSVATFHFIYWANKWISPLWKSTKNSYTYRYTVKTLSVHIKSKIRVWIDMCVRFIFPRVTTPYIDGRYWKYYNQPVYSTIYFSLFLFGSKYSFGLWKHRLRTFICSILNLCATLLVTVTAASFSCFSFSLESIFLSIA